MMNTLRRKSILRQNSRPSLLSFNSHESQHFNKLPQDCETLRTIHSTQNANYNVPQNDYNHQVYNDTNNKKSKCSSVPKYYRNRDIDLEDEGGFYPNKKHTLPLEAETNYHYSTSRTPYDRCYVPVNNNTGHLDGGRVNNYNDSRYDQEQRYPDGYDTRKTDQRKRTTSLLKKQISFRQYLGYPTSNTSTGGPSTGPVSTITRSVGGVVKRRKHVVLLGLDGSGKTTILMRLKYRCYIATTPTVGFNHEKVWGGGFRWSAWDVGGGERVRPLWATYTRGTDGIVFVVNAAANSDTTEEGRLELARILKLSKATAVQLGRPAPPLLVLANFQDNSRARNAPEVAKSLCLPQEGHSAYSGTTVTTSCWAVACVCGLTGEGLDEALNTLRHLMDHQGGAQTTKTKNRALDRWR